MAEPLDYRNANAPQATDENASRKPAGPRPAIPVEFDTLLTRTSDLAAATAIEKLLAEQKIACYRTDDGRAVDRVVQLHVRAADQARASELAAGIFVRRKKFKSYARPEIPRMSTPSILSVRAHFPGEW